MRILHVNVSGRQFHIPAEAIAPRLGSCLERGESTLLLDLLLSETDESRYNLCDFYDIASSTFYFFGRNIAIFEKGLLYHSRGKFHLGKNSVCLTEAYSELDFWKIPHDAVVSNCPCCMQLPQFLPEAPEEPFTDVNSALLTQTSVISTSPISYSTVKAQKQEELRKALDEAEGQKLTKMFSSVCLGKQRRKAWVLMEDYTSSPAAKGFAIVSVGFAVTSILIMIIGSIPDCQVYSEKNQEMLPHPTLELIELICVVWFTVEYSARLILTPCRCEYVKGAMQIIDVLAILPSYTDYGLELFGIDMNQMGGVKGAFLALRLLRVLRVMRVFRLARYNTGLKQLGETLRASKKEMSVLSVFFTSLVLLFSTTMYYLEKDVPNTTFVSIPAACWWCVITITTVGYGDLVPQTVGGQLVATVACLAGIIVLAFPITMIIENFNEQYRGSTEGPPDPNAPKIKRIKM